MFLPVYRSSASEGKASAIKSASRGLIPVPRIRRPPFFFAGEYPVDARSKDRFSEHHWKRFVAPARWGDAGDSVVGGGSSADATASLVTSDDGAFGERGEV